MALQGANTLATLSDDGLAEVLARATPVGAGIGGTVATAAVDGVQVFIMTIRLTDLERLPGNVQSTANLFGLPLEYQYGLSSAGFGVWRELAAHRVTTDWVLSGACSRKSSARFSPGAARRRCARG